MPNFFISTIIRDCEKHFNNYSTMLLALENKLNQIYNSQMVVSIYESDSIDNTKDLLTMFAQKESPFLKSVNIEYNGFRKFGPVKETERVINLAWCRNRTINNMVHLMKPNDVVISIEPDIVYNTEDAVNLIRDFINEKNDIRSGIVAGVHGAGRYIHKQFGVDWSFYDTWALRINKDDKSGDIYEDFQTNPVKHVWATYSGLCVYKADFFLRNGRYGYISPFTNNYDCDTTVICENFRSAGYNNIVMDQSKICYHM